MGRYAVAEVIIRPITVEDADAVAELWQSLVEYHQRLSPDLPAAAKGGAHRYVRRMLDRLSDPYTHAIVAEFDGQVIGFLLGVIVDLMPDMFAQQPAGFLADIYVEPSHRRRGVGRALVNDLVSWFRQCGVHTFDWHVASSNPEGIRFWRAVGGRDVMIRMRADIGGDHD